MKLTIENKAYQEKTLVKSYGKDFLTKVNSTFKTCLENDSIHGTMEDLNFDGVSIWIRDLVTSDIFEERISNDFSMFKLCFTMRGSSHFSSKNVEKDIQIPQGYCNLFYFRKIKGVQKLIGDSVSTVEILFTKNYLISLLGESYVQVVKAMEGFPSNKNVSCLFEKSRKIPPKLISFLLDIVECPYSGRTRESWVKAKIDCILIELLLGKHPYLVIDSNILRNTNHAAILKVEAYIKQNLKKRLTIDHLSSVARLNTTKLKHDFKKVFLTTIFKHITQLRMEKAKQLVLDKDYSIAQASYEVGYTNPQHFTVAFKKTMGYLPSKLKENDL